jgi:hypothetical protein
VKEYLHGVVPDLLMFSWCLLVTAGQQLATLQGVETGATKPQLASAKDAPFSYMYM